MNIYPYEILLVSTSDTTGGAAIACSRLLEALHKQGAAVNLLVQSSKESNKNVISLAKSLWQKGCSLIRFTYERLLFFLKEKDASTRFAFSPANTGVDITQHPAFLSADIIHLHWINGGFLSIKSLEKIAQSGKVVLWTLHDMWAFTGGCHQAGTCRGYKNQCGHCPMLSNPHSSDLSARLLKRKKTLFQHSKFHFITCSNWLQIRAKSSALLKNATVTSLPNAIDTNFYQPQNKTNLRKKYGICQGAFLILFGAYNINHPKKGFSYLLEALQILASRQACLPEKIEVLIFGKSKGFDKTLIPFKVHALDYLHNQETIAELYTMANVLAYPSLADNLPNTLLESMACGTPAVAFSIGGIPEIITHQENGYLCNEPSAEALIEGIVWVLRHPNILDLNQKARQKVLDSFSEPVVSQKHLALYASLLAAKNL